MYEDTPTLYMSGKLTQNFYIFKDDKFFRMCVTFEAGEGPIFKNSVCEEKKINNKIWIQGGVWTPPPNTPCIHAWR